MRNKTMAAAGRFSKGIVCTPSNSFLKHPTASFVFIKSHTGEPRRKSSAFDYSFDEIPI